MDFKYIAKKLLIVYSIAAGVLVISYFMDREHTKITLEMIKFISMFLIAVAPLIATSRSFGGVDTSAVTAKGGRGFLYYFFSLGLSVFFIYLFCIVLA